MILKSNEYSEVDLKSPTNDLNENKYEIIGEKQNKYRYKQYVVSSQTATIARMGH